MILFQATDQHDNIAFNKTLFCCWCCYRVNSNNHWTDGGEFQGEENKWLALFQWTSCRGCVSFVLVILIIPLLKCLDLNIVLPSLPLTYEAPTRLNQSYHYISFTAVLDAAIREWLHIYQSTYMHTHLESQGCHHHKYSWTTPVCCQMLTS